MAGHLIAFEGLDQSGKQTQAERLAAALRTRGATVQLVSFPDYATPIGAEITQALAGARPWTPDVLQLLYVANRLEYRPRLETWLKSGTIVIADRYIASSIAYGEAQGLDAAWMADVQRPLPAPSLTILLDIAPEVSLARKQADRDKFERDLALLGRVRECYLRQADAGGWVRLDGRQDKDAVTDGVLSAVSSRLGVL